MGYREMLLTIGAITIFSLTTVSISRHMSNNMETIYENQATYLLYHYANSIIQQAKTRAFDESTINAVPTNVTGFAYPGAKGGTESLPFQVDDVDDYNGWVTTATDAAIGTVNLSVSVIYVNDTDLNTNAETQTFYKKMIVTATNNYVSQPVTAVYVFAYQKNF